MIIYKNWHPTGPYGQTVEAWGLPGSRRVLWHDQGRDWRSNIAHDLWGVVGADGAGEPCPDPELDYNREVTYEKLMRARRREKVIPIMDAERFLSRPGVASRVICEELGVAGPEEALDEIRRIWQLAAVEYAHGLSLDAPNEWWPRAWYEHDADRLWRSRLEGGSKEAAN